MAATPSLPNGSDDGQAQRRVRVLGYLRGPAPDGLDCESPLRVLVSDSGNEYREVWRCRNHRRSKCRPCATRYRGRVESVAADGMFRQGGFYYLLTLTAPGDREHRMPSGKLCPCTPVGGVELSRWNPDAGRCWNRFLVAVERRYLVRPRYFRSAETQDRGALHHHVIVWSPRKLHVRTLRPLAMAAGYGHEVDLQALTPGSRKAARYVSKYVTKSADSRDEVPWWATWVDEETGEVCEGLAPATFRTWSSSRDWGVSMQELLTQAVQKWRERHSTPERSERQTGLVPIGPPESPPAPS